MAIKFGTLAKAAAIGGVALHTIKTVHGKPIKPYKDPEKPVELNRPLKIKPKENPIAYTNYVYSGDHMGHLVFKFDYAFRVPDELLQYNQRELAEWLREKILSKRDKKEDYIAVRTLRKTAKEVEFVFDEKKWFDDTLKGAKAELGYIPDKVIIHYTVALPDLVAERHPRTFLEQYLERTLHQYFKRNRSKMKFQKWFKWLEKISPDMFDYDIDWYRSTFVLKLKTTVVLGALAAAFGITKYLKKHS